MVVDLNMLKDLQVPKVNDACVMTGIGKLEFEERPLPADPGVYE
jgi:hypothetical protein